MLYCVLKLKDINVTVVSASNLFLQQTSCIVTACKTMFPCKTLGLLQALLQVYCKKGGYTVNYYCTVYPLITHLI